MLSYVYSTQGTVLSQLQTIKKYFLKYSKSNSGLFGFCFFLCFEKVEDPGHILPLVLIIVIISALIRAQVISSDREGDREAENLPQKGGI